MKILFTGASSFTGYWFVKELLKEGNEIYTIHTKSSIDEYEDLYKTRLINIASECHPFFNIKFGDEKFISLLKNEKFDVLCHHAAYVKNYKHDNFDYIEALKENSNNIHVVIKLLKDNGCNTVILTGSIFENGEGQSDNNLRAVSSYGLSKSLTATVFNHFCNFHNMKLGKFVIANPFGCFEEKRFTNYLIKAWFNKEIPTINTPLYIRDNIPINVLAKAYSLFVKKVFLNNELYCQINPSGFINTVDDFAKMLSKKIKSVTNLPCQFQAKEQFEFNEPKIKFNIDPILNELHSWNEDDFWKEYIEYYKEIYGN